MDEMKANSVKTKVNINYLFVAGSLVLSYIEHIETC